MVVAAWCAPFKPQLVVFVCVRARWRRRCGGDTQHELLVIAVYRTGRRGRSSRCGGRAKAAAAVVLLVFSVFRIIIIIVMTNAAAENRDDYYYRRRNSYDGNWLLLPAIVVAVVCIYLRVLFYFRIQPRPT